MHSCRELTKILETQNYRDFIILLLYFFFQKISIIALSEVNGLLFQFGFVTWYQLYFFVSNFYAKVSVTIKYFFLNFAFFILYILTRKFPCSKYLQSRYSFSEVCLASKFSGFFSLSSFLNYFTRYMKTAQGSTDFSRNLLRTHLQSNKQMSFVLTTKFCLSKASRRDWQ